MSRLVSRILLAVLLFPLAAMFYMLVFVTLEHRLIGYRSQREKTAFLIAGSATWIAVILYWYLLWRPSVRWNRTRIAWSVLSVPLASFAGVAVGILATIALFSNDPTFGTFIGAILATLLWLVATVFIWRETPSERTQRVVGTDNTIACPTCGYNLTGLSESRCPECGSKFTLDELLAGQPTAAVDIE